MLSPRNGGRRKLWGRLALSAASVLVALAMLELGLRVARPHSTEQLDIGAFMAPSNAAGPRKVLLPGAENPHFVGGPVRVNQDGLRGPEVVRPKPADTLRLLAVGDSNTFGYGVAEEQTWHHLAAARLAEERGAPVESLNAGLPGAGFAWQFHFLRRRCAELEPDLVLLSIVMNDIEAYPPTALDTTPLPPVSTSPVRVLAGFLNRHSYLAATLYRDVRSALYEAGVMDVADEQGYGYAPLEAPSAALDAAWRSSEHMLRAVDEQVRACGVPAVWVVFPLELQLSPELLTLYQRDYRLPVGADALDGLPQQRLRALAASLQVGFVDLLPAFQARAAEGLFLRDNLLTVDPVHPSVLGHQVTADVVADALSARAFAAGPEGVGRATLDTSDSETP